MLHLRCWPTLKDLITSWDILCNKLLCSFCRQTIREIHLNEFSQNIPSQFLVILIIWWIVDAAILIVDHATWIVDIIIRIVEVAFWIVQEAIWVVILSLQYFDNSPKQRTDRCGRKITPWWTALFLKQITLISLSARSRSKLDFGLQLWRLVAWQQPSYLVNPAMAVLGAGLFGGVCTSFGAKSVIVKIFYCHNVR